MSGSPLARGAVPADGGGEGAFDAPADSDPAGPSDRAGARRGGGRAPRVADWSGCDRGACRRDGEGGCPVIRRLVVALRTDFDATTERWFAKSLEYGTVALGIFVVGMAL